MLVDTDLKFHCDAWECVAHAYMKLHDTFTTSVNCIILARVFMFWKTEADKYYKSNCMSGCD